MVPVNDVVVVGNIGIDTNVYLQASEIDFSVEANFTRNVDTIGQAGGYALRAYRGLGWRTGFIGTVGGDVWGGEIESSLRAAQVDLRALWIDDQGTSRSVNIINGRGQRRNFYDGGGHMHLQPPLESCQQVLRGSKLAHFNIPNWARQLLPMAREMGIKVACDIQDVVDAGDPYRQDFIQAADFLFFSATNFSDPDVLMRAMIATNPRATMLCGMGEAGCQVWDGERVTRFPAHVSDQQVIDTNGAGDTLGAVFLCKHVLQNRPVEEAVAAAQKAARLLCSMRADHKARLSPSEWKGLMGSQ